ncbi:O-methyltransferase [Cohnella rhizosphaerae]|uniref:O-methyltransferase n=1 Tax=Cohnella rhizosphaerae TaxID=1457232 RepID=A0A9X4QXA7_9BACL|nr:O-methyltransferase [Cohnella rhizosphaerae]MDG0814499.1 O-methyltransferase [Cohnella rhizosphaerae]
MAYEFEVPLARQVDMAFRQMEGELKGMTAGTIVLQVRNDTVGKFGIRHLPVDLAERRTTGDAKPDGLTDALIGELRKAAVEAIQRKTSWTHGEVTYDFGIKHGKLYLSVTVESNYNMANVLFHVNNKKFGKRDRSGEH